ncbi:dihydroorotase [Gottschalkiaceae bacterium SANA]|nr:dihydroorotase [Gottschalkiaceae bacterium SANA]
MKKYINLHLVDANVDSFGDLWVNEEGKIEKIVLRSSIRKESEEGDFDGWGLTCMPSFIDLHGHFREPGQERKETIQSGIQSAAKGGFGLVVAMANTTPICDEAELIQANQEKARRLGQAEYLQVSALTIGFGESPVDYTAIRPLTRLFSNDGKPIDRPSVMVKALEDSLKHDFLLMVHQEPEEEMIRRDLLLAEAVGGNLHICHVSTKESVDLIRSAKKRGVKVTCEVTPHHLYCANETYRVNPPFGTEVDRQALMDGLKDGSIDCVATDHAPHTEEDKAAGSPGITGYDAAFSLVRTALPDASLCEISKWMSANPAAILGADRRNAEGRLEVGKEANFVFLRPDQPRILNTFYSKSDNTPFVGDKVLGVIEQTIRKGERIDENA